MSKLNVPDRDYERARLAAGLTIHPTGGPMLQVSEADYLAGVKNKAARRRIRKQLAAAERREAIEARVIVHKGQTPGRTTLTMREESSVR